jgi:Uma2 family endonuclease
LTTITTTSPLMTASEFAARPDPGYPEELVRGRIVRMPPPSRRHGQVCGQAYYLIRQAVERQSLGHVLSNGAGIITTKDPDTVRGADVAFDSFARLPRGPLPASYGSEVPELVVEVLSPTDRWSDVLSKVTEYLHAGVVAVVVLDPAARTAQVFRDNQAPRTLADSDELTLPDILGDFAAVVGRFFD